MAFPAASVLLHGELSRGVPDYWLTLFPPPHRVPGETTSSFGTPARWAAIIRGPSSFEGSGPLDTPPCTQKFAALPSPDRFRLPRAKDREAKQCSARPWFDCSALVSSQQPQAATVDRQWHRPRIPCRRSIRPPRQPIVQRPHRLRRRTAGRRSRHPRIPLPFHRCHPRHPRPMGRHFPRRRHQCTRVSRSDQASTRRGRPLCRSFRRRV